MKVPMPQASGQSCAWADQKTWFPLCVWTSPSSRLEPPVWATAEPMSTEPTAQRERDLIMSFIVVWLSLAESWWAAGLVGSGCCCGFGGCLHHLAAWHPENQGTS